MQQIFKDSKLIAISNCACRKNHQLCSAPLDVCFSLNETAQEYVNEGSARQVSLEEALDALRRASEAGLILTQTLKGEEASNVICCCCSCCCNSLGVFIRQGKLDAVVAGEYVANWDLSTCINCGKCVSRCQFDAFWIDESIVKFDQRRCFGCGVCVSTCPTDSISLIPR